VSALPAVVPPPAAEKDLARRLDALAELVKIGKPRAGGDGISPALIDDSEALLRRAGERLRLSGSHTVVALAGGTGSGKSTLFNTLAGATFSPPGVTRPTTRHVHACVWGMQGAGPLLDWLGVQRRHRYARASALDSGESALNGLLLLDLPDHDSVVTASMAAVDRLTKLADMLIFVLDPQKYADASVHRRYLIPLAGHASVITVVLNQVDLLPPEQVDDCEQDLRRLLDAEGLHDTLVLPVSARTGAGLDALRGVLTDAVAAQYAASERISADIDSLAGGFAIHAKERVAPQRAVRTVHGDAQPGEAGGPEEGVAGTGDDATAAPAGAGVPPAAMGRAPWDAASWDDQQPLSAPVAVTRPPWEDARPEGSPQEDDVPDPVSFIPDEPAGALTEAFAQAAGISAVAQTMASAREAQAARYTGWPVARLARRRRDPVRELREIAASDARDGPSAGTAPRQAPPASRAPAAFLRPAPQQSEVDNAITRFADAVGGQLPAPWSRSLRDVARSGAAQVPDALTAAVRAGSEGKGKGQVPRWWQLIALWQWLLAALAVAGVCWSAVIAAGHGASGQNALLSDTSLIPWLLITAAAVLLLGWLTASGCQNMALVAAEREQERAETEMHARVAAVARDLVLTPAGHEIEVYELFRASLEAAQAPLPPAPLALVAKRRAAPGIQGPLAWVTLAAT
jgi:energy-coupling factor transporter ATP-binding protein EcfA2